MKSACGICRDRSYVGVEGEIPKTYYQRSLLGLEPERLLL